MNTEDKRLIINLLKNEELSSREIAEKTGITIKEISLYISDLKKQGKIYRSSPKKYRWGLRIENSENEFIMSKYDWVYLSDIGVKLYYKNLCSFQGWNDDGFYIEYTSEVEIYCDHELFLTLGLLWYDYGLKKCYKFSTEGKNCILNLSYIPLSKTKIKIVFNHYKKGRALFENG